MKVNRDVYLVDPSQQKLVNEGVASVNDSQTSEAMSVLRYELRTFVCEGQYAGGMQDILDTFLRNIDQAEQPGVWVNGFYGSGKSHLVKMLRAVWEDTRFEDSATARGIADLPQEIKELLRELSAEGKRHGGLHAASGTLGSGASGSVRLNLLRIVFKSVGLPEAFGVARFVLWLKENGIYEEVRQQVEQRGSDWEEELDNFYVADDLPAALMQVRPNLFASPEACRLSLGNQYPAVQDVSSDEMVKVIRQALTREGRFPLTLIVLDEVQQYISESRERSSEVQEAVEACCKSFGGKLMFIGTGQSAVTEANMKKLEGRFTVRVSLSDTDVDTVVRKVILAKKPEAKSYLEQVLQPNLGEISRHLSATRIGHREEDIANFSQDYPILPVRRRFWENALRILDQTGTDSQLRNQLSMVHKATQLNLDKPLGNVVPADYLYFDASDKLLQARVLPRKIYDRTLTWSQGTPDERLMARACGLVFLINKLNATNQEVGIKATAETLADLLVEDLSNGSAALRSKLPGLLDGCELLMKVGDEYRIQTEESTAWNDEFISQRNSLASELHRIDTERDDRIRKVVGELIGKLAFVQGASKVSRDIHPTFEANLPSDTAQKVYVWVRDGWSVDENSVRAEARQAGTLSPTVFVYIPKRNADDLRHHLLDYKAAVATLDRRGSPTSDEGSEARAAMETVKNTAEARIKTLLGEAFAGGRVFQGGGQEIVGTSLQEMVREASDSALQRLYPQFNVADHAGWAKVYEKAAKGAPDALKAVGDTGEVANNSVCKAVLAAIAGGKKGTEIRTHFQTSPYGWSQDAIDGALLMLLVAGLIRAHDDHGKPIVATELERKNIGKTNFKIEATTVSASQRLLIRKLFQKAGFSSNGPEKDLLAAQQLVAELLRLAGSAGGEAPKPELPDTDTLEDIRRLAGNDQLLALYNRREELEQNFDAWTSLTNKIGKRWPDWLRLKRLSEYAEGLKDAGVILGQVEYIEKNRQLLEEPDPIAPLVANLAQLLRDELNRLDGLYEQGKQQGEARLKADVNWQKLEPEQRNALLQEQHLHDAARPVVHVATTSEVLTTLQKVSLATFTDRVAAMPARFDAALAEAARLCEPEVQFVRVSRETLRTEEEIDAWLATVRKELVTALAGGPVVIK